MRDLRVIPLLIGEVPLIGKGADCNSVRHKPTTGSSPVLFNN